jgi:aconitate hydratase
VKTSFTPGSKVVTEYLKQAGLLAYLETLGFFVSGIGCATCIGNSGPLPAEISKAIEDNHLITAAVISGNRNFEGRVHPLVQANYLASPALVVAYAIAGNVRTNLSNEPVGYNPSGAPVFLSKIMPTLEDIRKIEREVISPDLFHRKYSDLFVGDSRWKSIQSPTTDLYQWEAKSTYLKETPFCGPVEPLLDEITNARALAVFGDSITTDHISPAGAISSGTPAARYLQSQAVQPVDFNTYGSRRGNHEVMMRGTFANIRIQNLLVPHQQGGKTLHLPDAVDLDIFDAAMLYAEEKVPLIILAGKEYGTGSSRDWAAKGPKLLGVKAVIAESFERIHRSNLAGMGILPLLFRPGDSVSSLGVSGRETFTIRGLDHLAPSAEVIITAVEYEKVISFKVLAALNSAYETACVQHGGIFQLLE